MFKAVPSQLDLPRMENRILEFWKENRTFQRLRDANENGTPWSFLDGPITANNPMGVHHAWGRTYKDIFQRYKSMRGHRLRYQNGYDCQGLWVEVEVEKALGFKSKQDIIDYGVGAFVQRCKERVFKYSRIQTEQSIRLGYWMDWANSYYTMSSENNYTIWLFLKQCHDHGWIYQGHDVMPWCPRCSCALSEHEIATEGYKEITHTAVFLLFPLKGRENEHLLVWTTTPWTLSSNVAAAVHPELTYIKVRDRDRILYLSKGVESILNPGYEIVDEIPGSEMVGWTYDGPFDELPPQEGVEHRVIAWEEVSETEGTGIVHIAPGCGKEDFALSREWDLSVIAPLNEYGEFLDSFAALSGQTAGGVARTVFDSLESKGILYKLEDYEHRYPVCWRCDSELVFRLVDEWFIGMDEIRPKIMDVAKRITWMPSFGLDRELDWLRNMHDWCISKKRFWGLALPIYTCPNGHFDVLGSETELRERSVEGWEQFAGHSPHRPWIDGVKIACSTCGETASRIEDVGNPWLDAGIVPYSTMGYRNRSETWKEWFPPDFITECFPGQFRNWFYSLLAMSTVLEYKEPFKVVLGYALVKDEKGQDMHKSKGNAIWFDDAAEEVGVEPMRWIFARQNPYVNLNFGYGQTGEAKRRLSTLWNSYSFFITYANVDGVTADDIPGKPADPSLLDRWIMARLSQLATVGRDSLDRFELSGFTKAAESFLDDLSNWYIRRSRRRFWKSQSDTDKASAYATLYHVLLGFCRVVAPVIPFLTEEIYQNLAPAGTVHSRGSVHLEPYPLDTPDSEDEELIAVMAMAQEMVTIGHAARNRAGIKVRQPLNEARFKGWPSSQSSLWKQVEPLVRDELNVKSITLVAADEELAAVRIKPEFPKLGPRLGGKMKLLQSALTESVEQAAAAFSSATSWSVELDGEQFDIAPDEVIVEKYSPDGWIFHEGESFQISLDVTITDQLLREGQARDLVRRIQNLRKEADLEVSDRIEVYLAAEFDLAPLLDEQGDYIRQEVLAECIELKSPPSGSQSTEFSLGDANVFVGLIRSGN